MIDSLRAELEQISVQDLVQIKIQDQVSNRGEPSGPSVFAVVDLATNPPLIRLFEVIAQRLTKCVAEFGPERTARGRFGLLILGIDGDRTRAAEVKEAADRMIDRYGDGSLATSRDSAHRPGFG